MVPQYDMTVDESGNSTNLGALFNAAFQLSSQHEVGAKLLQSVGNRSGLFQEGIVEGSESNCTESRIHFTSETSPPIAPQSCFPELLGAKLDWDFSVKSSQEERLRHLFRRDRRRSLPGYGWEYRRDSSECLAFPDGFTNRRLWRDLERTPTN